MASLKCPYCTAVRTSRSRLQMHVDGIHRDADTRENRYAAVLNARTVEDVVTELPEPVLCICGAAIKLVDEDTEPDWWTHINDGTSVCQDPAPAKDTIAAQGRETLSERLAETGVKLKQTRAEMKALQAKADEVLDRLVALDAGVMDPDVVRRATLNQVWDRLVDAGSLGGAQIVMRMIKQLSDGDWS